MTPMWRWLSVAVVIGCSKQAAPSPPRITCTDCSTTKSVPEAFATHTKLRVETSWQGECETDVVVTGKNDTRRDVCKQVQSEATMTCDGCVVTRLFGDRYEVLLSRPGTATVRGNFRPVEARQVGTAMLGPLRVV